MFAKMLENLIKEAMAGHIFSFNGTIYCQASGGAIGNILTRALASLFMVWWSRQFQQKLLRATSDIPGFKLILQKYYGSPWYKNVPRAGSPGYTSLQRAGCLLRPSCTWGW